MSLSSARECLQAEKPSILSRLAVAVPGFAMVDNLQMLKFR